MKNISGRTKPDVTRMTAKGQVVIPRLIRQAMKIDKGTVFAVRHVGDTVLLEVIR